MDDLLRLIREEVARQLDRPQTTGWATVTSTSPLTVKVDGDADPQPSRKVDPAGITVGARCLRLRVGSRWYILGGTSG